MTTQFANASYQEIIDIKTEADKTSIIGIHTPNDSKPVNMLAGFWEQFRQFKYNGCTIQLVPAARLPADISMVGYGAGEAPIDMRDILNPILFKGCHGDDLGVILNTALNGPSTGSPDISSSVSRSDSPVTGLDPYESLYYRALTDNSWQKADPQRGFRKSGLHPLVHTVVTNHSYGQYAPGYAGSNVLDSTLAPEGLGQFGPVDTVTSPTANTPGYAGSFRALAEPAGQIVSGQSGIISSSYNMAFFTNRLVRMSWQDTHSRIPVAKVLETSEQAGSDAVANALVYSEKYETITNRRQTVPLAYMGIMVLPPAYKAEQYFRMVINHSFSFRRFRGVSMAPGQNVSDYTDGNVIDEGGYYNGVQ